MKLLFLQFLHPLLQKENKHKDEWLVCGVKLALVGDYNKLKIYFGHLGLCPNVIERHIIL